MLLLVPLSWYGYLHGINPSPFDAERWPGWYSIGYQVVAQLSSIFLAPVWTLGLSLLYVDERVRHEGYDIELMAARQLGEIPAVSSQFVNPLQSALATTNLQNLTRKKDSSILGLD